MRLTFHSGVKQEARVMGYKPMEFLNAYGENLRNQSREAITFSALGDILRTICDEDLTSVEIFITVVRFWFISTKTNTTLCH